MIRNKKGETMAKKNKVKKTLVEQILTKAKVEHQGLQIYQRRNWRRYLEIKKLP